VETPALCSPAQVAPACRRLFGNRYHPIWTMIAWGCMLMAAGLLLFPPIRRAAADHPAVWRRYGISG
jgi:hypothetical protein